MNLSVVRVLPDGGPGSTIVLGQSGGGSLVVATAGPKGEPGADGATVRKTAAVAMSGHRAVVASGETGLAYADAMTPEHACALIGIIRDAVAPGSSVEIHSVGEIGGLSGLVTGGPIYCGPDGVLTQSPGPWAWLRIVGYATTATTLQITLMTPVATET